MKLRRYDAEDLKAIVHLFRSVFAKSEGETEGALIGKLAADLFETSDEHDLFNYVAVDDRLVGSIFFSRLKFDNNDDVFILGPVAVQSDRQGEGIGKALISHGLEDLTNQGVRAVLTYGDPTFYEKVGFHTISPSVIEAPFELSQPDGWLGQSLIDNHIETLSGRCTCVTALNDPAYW